MDAKRQWSLLTAIVCVVVLLAGFFLLVSPAHRHANSLHKQVTATQAQTSALRAQLAVLESEQRNEAGQQAQLAAVEQKLPNSPDLPGLITGIDALGAAAGLDLVDVAPGAPAAATTTGTTGTSTTSTTATATPTPSASASSATTATAASGTLAGVGQIPVAITAKGTYFQLENFLSKLETFKRGLLVDTFSLTPGQLTKTGSGKSASTALEISLSLTGRVFLATTPVGAAASTAN